MSAIPDKLRTSLAALALLTGIGGGTWAVSEAARLESERNAYIQAVAADPEASDAVRIAMVMASFYESSNRHIGVPYVDKAGKGQPLTVCNGITGPEVVAGRYYSREDCRRLELRRYQDAERWAKRAFTHWGEYNIWVQASMLDMAFNLGEAAVAGSTLMRLANAGDLEGACEQMPRWVRGTVDGRSVVLPGLVDRRGATRELCAQWGRDGHFSVELLAGVS